MMNQLQEVSDKIADKTREIEGKYPGLYTQEEDYTYYYDQGVYIYTVRHDELVHPDDQKAIDSLHTMPHFSPEKSVEEILHQMLDEETVDLDWKEKHKIIDRVRDELEEEWYKISSVLDKDQPLNKLFKKRLKSAEVKIGEVFDTGDKWSDIQKAKEIFASCQDLQKRHSESEMPERIKCPSCGAVNEGSSLSCSQCGYGLSEKS